MKNPKLFISYSWSGPDHEEWVIKLAEELVGSGIDAILDKWHLREGHDANQFMEKMVNDNDIQKVILICDKNYKEKADGRLGGAGTEAQIISPTLYGSTENNKFCAVVAERDDLGKPFIPTYYTSRIYIDLCDDTKRTENFERLVRWVFDKPLLVRPEIGVAPSYITEADAAVQLHTSSRARRAIDLIKNGKPLWRPALRDYFETVSRGLEEFRITDVTNLERDVFKSIDDFTPYRNELIEVIAIVARYGPSGEAEELHKFFEEIIVYRHRPARQTSYREIEFDGFRFITFELFILTVSVLASQERFDLLAVLLQRDFYAPDARPNSNDPMVPFLTFSGEIASIENRNRQQKTIYYYPRAKFLLDRIVGTSLSKKDVMQADVLLALASRADAAGRHLWLPETLPFEGNPKPLPIFARASSRWYFHRLQPAIGLTLEEMQELVTRMDANGGLFRMSTAFGASIGGVTAIDKIATKP